ncbi:molybdopterin converting factor subunit 1 [Kingella negevensis]|uniref:molybdopterin converting factor subunit 1 n=1 Tax=Kingella negevensis TaxID=1522312 RepID=UPI000A266F4F|nr:molybdopterin converting factor subunit 1 [Kingella negevensis]MDK4688731.1 molybdopterin converting factor subunit 1 [Kingella negevensis]WII91528.1 molybdopterin converting factor subunit 1 [Kingella negevensis]
MSKQINILYFAALREQAGKEQETRDTSAQNPAELYAELQAAYSFELPQERLRAAVNHAFCAWDTPLNEGDIVAFIPPVSGG